MLNIVGLILARGGSKRLPNKNLRILGDKPLIAWTIETANASRAFSRVIVSTDSRDVADVSQRYGAEIPWLRPPQLSTDCSPSIDSVMHALEQMSEDLHHVDGIMLLQPTSPFRSTTTIESAVEIFRTHNLGSVVSFSRVDISPEWCFRIDETRLTPLLDWNAVTLRSQEIKQTFQLNGLIYLASPSHLSRYRSFLSPETVPLFSNDLDEIIDIDTASDWECAEQVIRNTKFL
jgi:CMP-N,N'-diacetyllegionaminic acid synthase